MIAPHRVDKRSPFLGEACALCKEPLGPGDEIVICPEDATRHHSQCWQANGNRCSAYGCDGAGAVRRPAPPRPARRPRIIDQPPDNEPLTATNEPGSGVSCAQSCLIIAIAAAIVVIAFSCFGLWAIADYIMLEVLGWPYRAPVEGLGWEQIGWWGMAVPVLLA